MPGQADVVIGNLQFAMLIQATLTPAQVTWLEEVVEKAISAAVEKYSGNMSLVAKALNVSRPTLYSKLKKYGI